MICLLTLTLSMPRSLNIKKKLTGKTLEANAMRNKRYYNYIIMDASALYKLLERCDTDELDVA